MTSAHQHVLTEERPAAIDALSRGEVLLALQVALIGAVTPKLRGVTCGWTSGQVEVLAIYEAEPDEVEAELMSVCETEMIAYLPSDVRVQQSLRVVPPFRPINLHLLEAWAYRRWEPGA
jgi:hypothetical protein